MNIEIWMMNYNINEQDLRRNNTMELNPKIKEALLEMQFVNRFEELSKTFSAERTPSDKRLIYVDGEEVMDMISSMGYTPLFNRKEKFYKIKEEHVDKYSFNFHICLRSGMVELIWGVKENGKIITGEPWNIYPRLLIDPNYIIRYPFFGSYEDLEEILRIAFSMYEDLKKNIIHNSGIVIDL